MRAFVAIELPGAVVDQIVALQEHLRAGRPVEADNLHLTLAFLGDQSDSAMVAVDEALQALRAPGFDLELAGIDTFGGDAPHVVCLGARPNPALEALHRKVMAALRGAGLDLGRVRFRPHVTLARFGRGLDGGERDRLGRFLSARADAHLPPFRVDHFTLYRSILGKGAPVHQALADYPLGAVG
ncbi:RNA 2',3'-cyclic phosphodiesterase [Pontitalea aquivivens]|uniref:RNA 2',3'-cyclic phosphodiesterase n=1 Tax=Pontitalea aquivivens TaxID=3388663 RepID=UPI003970B090